MFRKTDPQGKLFGVEATLPEGMRARLKSSWAEVFRREILPILMRSEERFGDLYGITGRPNFSVGRMLALCLLQELCDYSDQEALDAFGFDARWQYATDIHADEEAYLSRRSMVEFRSRLARHDPEMALMHGVFEAVSDAAIEKLGLSVREQRLDSTHVASNIHTHGRIDLFKSTIEVFLRSLKPAQYGRLPESIRRWFEEESSGWFGLGTKEQKKEKLQRLADFLLKLIELFKEDEGVKGSPEYGLLVRLFREQCEVKSPKDSEPRGGGDVDGGGEGGEVEIALKKNESGDTLQSPHDPDATYGHKGVGYSAQIVETCNNDEGKPEIITAFEVHGAARSDIGKALDVLEQLENTSRKPEVLFADGGYPTASSMPEIAKRGVEMVAPVNRGPMSAEVMGRNEFQFDEHGRIAKCPAGHGPIDHRELSNGEERNLHAVFDGDTCRSCPMLERCPVRAPNHRAAGCSPRQTKGNFRLEVTEGLLMRDEIYAAQQTPEWKERYKIRAGIEATMSEAKRCHGLDKLRVRGIVRVRFAVTCKIIACNIRRWAKAAIAASNGGCPNAPPDSALIPLEPCLSMLYAA